VTVIDLESNGPEIRSGLKLPAISGNSRRGKTLKKYLVGIIPFLAWVWFGVVPAEAAILIVAPHPDDDLLIAAGVTRAAIQRGESVTVLYVTNGDLYGGTAAGQTRQGEAVAGQGLLGTNENSLVFLGYPDGYLTDLYVSYPNSGSFLTTSNGLSATYGYRGLGSVDYHTYRFGSPARYNGYNLVRDLQDIIATRRPDHILTTAEFDRHPDHAATYRAVRDAVVAVTAAAPTYVPTIDIGLVHDAADWAWPNPLSPLADFVEPQNAQSAGFLWSARASLNVPSEMQATDLAANLKYRAIETHSTQGGAGSFLGQFVHKDEFFWPVALTGANRPPRVDAGLDQSVSQGTTVQLNGGGSNDPDGGTLSYQWRQVGGRAATLSSNTIASPAFSAPSGLTANELLIFELIVSDGVFRSLPDYVSVTVQAEANIASLATVSASSQNVATNQQAAKAVDGVSDGYPGDYTREWATAGQGVGAWIQLNWATPYQIDRVVLHDRPNYGDQITSATLTFSDGSTVAVGALPNDGTGLEVRFGPVVTTRVRLTVNTVSATTGNVGLAEFEVYGSAAAGGNLPPVANAGANQAVAEGASVVLDGRGSTDPNGDTLSYRWSQTAGSAVTLMGANTSTPSFTAPTGLTANAALTFSLIVNDGYFDSAASTTTVTVASANPSANISSQATVTASSENVGTNQQASKAVDGVSDGYPGDYTREWATVGQGAGAWLNLNWGRAYQIDRVVLHDRPNGADQITSATLTFSDGSTVAVGVLPNDGTGLQVRFGPVVTTWVRLTINTVSGATANTGLSEIEVYGR
jgi:LmbE family N-acetylglucosaminyl deacetylase